MPYGRKRPRYVKRKVPVSRAVNTALRVGNWSALASAGRSMAKRRRIGGSIASLRNQITALNRTIETKEGCYRVLNQDCPHNNLLVLNDNSAQVFNPFKSTNGTTDPMDSGSMIRLGDSIKVQGVLFRGFFEASLSRTKVYFRLMLIKMAKGDTLDRSTFFKGASTNKMIDQYNKERFTIVAQKIFTVEPPNAAAATVNLNGTVATATPSGNIGSRIIKMWIPGSKFGRNGVIQYENASTTQLKFFDYRLAIVVYDWYGTPQDVNNVGKINELYCKTYFKDA